MAQSHSPNTVDRYLSHRHFVEAIARRIVQDAHLAEDIAQEAWFASRGLPANHSAPYKFFARVAGNLARFSRRSGARRLARERSAARAESTISTASIVEREFLRKRIVEAVLALDEPSRSTLLMRFYDELPPREISRITGVPVATVKMRIARGLEHLRTSLISQFGSGASLASAFASLLSPPRQASSQFAARALLVSSAVIIILIIAMAARIAPREPATAAPIAERSSAENGNPHAATLANGTHPAFKRTNQNPHHTIKGVVLYEDNAAPCASARVGFRYTESGAENPNDTGSYTNTNNEGKFTLTIPRDEEDLTFIVTSPDAVYLRNETIPMDNPTSVTLWVKRAGRIEGRVVRRTGEAAADATVSLFTIRHDIDHFYRKTRTDSNGKYNFDGLCPGGFELDAFTDDGGVSLPLLISAEPGKATVVDVAIEKGIVVSGAVTDEEGQPVFNAEIMTIFRPDPRVGSFVGVADSRPRIRSGVNGAFQATLGRPGKYQITAASEGYISQGPPVEIIIPEASPNAQIKLKLRREPAGVVSIKITDINDFPAGLSARLENDPSRADSSNRAAVFKSVAVAPDGTARITGTGPGPFRLRIFSSRAPVAEVTTVQPDSQPIVITIPKPATLTGRVASAESKINIHKFTIDVMRVERDENRVATSSFLNKTIRSDDGKFQIGGFPAGEYRLSVSAPGHITKEIPALLVERDRSVIKLAITLERAEIGSSSLPAPGLNVAGVVRDATGAPVRGARVTFIIKNEPMKPRVHAWTAGDGSFNFKNISVGAGDLILWHETHGEAAFPSITIPKAAGTGLIQLQFPATGAITGFFKERDGTAIAGAHLILWPAELGNSAASALHSVSDASGFYKFNNVPPGKAIIQILETPVTARWRPEHFNIPLEVLVASGESIRANLLKPALPGPRVSGIVTMGGSPLPDAIVSILNTPKGVMLNSRTDSSGAYEIEGVPTGLQRIQVCFSSRETPISGSIYVRQNAEVTEAGRENINFNIINNTIKGAATAGGKPVAAARVFLQSIPVVDSLPNSSPADGGPAANPPTNLNSYTSADGGFEFNYVPAGEYVAGIRPSPISGVAAASIGRILIKDGEVLTIPCELAQAHKFSVEVISTDGKPVSGAHISLDVAGDGPLAASLFSLDATTGPSGSFIFQSAAAGDYQISIGATGYREHRSKIKIPSAEPFRVTLER